MVAPYLAAVTILNCIQVVLSGVMRGIGLQKVGAYTNLGAYYGVGLATAMILIFVFQFDGRGLWIGMLCGVMAQTVALTTISLFLNWESLVTRKPSHCQLLSPFLGLGHGIPSPKIQMFADL
jgi:MATE family multidrug resistance protein